MKKTICSPHDGYGYNDDRLKANGEDENEDLLRREPLDGPEPGSGSEAGDPEVAVVIAS